MKAGIQETRYLDLCKLFFAILVFVSGLGASKASAATYFLSPSGSDSSSGTSTSPWRSFGFAIPRLRPGDTLLVKNGTYSTSINIDCGSGTANGTASQPITIKAENERQAFIDGLSAGDGPLEIRNCSYWIVEGLRLEYGDNQSGTGDSIVQLLNSSNITIRRNLVRFNNRYHGSSHGIYLEETTASLIEENELYSYHRNGIILRNLSTTGNNIVRRNYVNSRNHSDIAGGASSCGIDCNRGDIAFISYNSNSVTFENNIAENSAGAYHDFAPFARSNHRFLGNIAVGPDLRDGCVHGIGDSTRQSSFGGNTVKDLVVVDHDAVCGLNATGQNNTVSNISLLGSRDGHGLTLGSEIANTHIQNVIATGQGREGISVSPSSGSWSLDYVAVFNNRTDFSQSSHPSITNKVFLTTNELGTCKVFVPTSAKNLKGRGKNGADIGANILYRYENGVLTNQPLWNPVTGEFPGGAIVPGVNDIAGSSRFDVHKRLNVNTNGCAFPPGYGGTASTAPSTSPQSTSPQPSSSSPSSSPSPAAAYSKLYEAESANLSGSMTVGTDSSAFGGKYISAASGTELTSPVREATLSVNLPAAGTYYLWARMMGPNYDNDALYVGINSSWSRIFPNATNLYEWVRIATSEGSGTFGFDLTQGTHTLQVGHGEIGARLDALFVTNDSSEVPPSSPSILPPSSPRNLVVVQ